MLAGFIQLHQNQRRCWGVLLVTLMRERIVSNSPQKPGCFAFDFDA